MRCAWQAFLNLVPIWMRGIVDKQGKDSLLELRLRLNAPPLLVTRTNQIWLDRLTSSEDLRFSINIASKYSPWAATTTAKGYITSPGGHRVGICGEAVVIDGRMVGIKNVSSLCIRIARDFPGIARDSLKYDGSVLVIGKPGSGKTTLLRDMIRQRSDKGRGVIAVVDEREEIFPRWNNEICFQTGRHTDVLSGCSKGQGIDAVLRNMSPDTIAVDEITAREDCNALIHAGWCGVRLLATAHAGCRQDLMSRPIYQPIVESGIFDTLIIMNDDKSWHSERMKI